MRSLVGLAVIPLIAGCTVPGSPFDESGTFDREHSTMTPADVRAFREFPLYWTGERFEGWNLTNVSGPAELSHAVTFIYGTCRLSGGDEPSCSPPIQIQVQPLCYQLAAVAHHGAWKKFRVRGAPLGGEPFRRVVFTADVQIRVVANRGSDPDRPDRVFAALASANGVGPQIGPGEPFPPAPLSVLAGDVPCAT